LRSYGKVYIDPVQVVVSTENGYKGVQPDVLKRMADSFKDSFVKALTPGYQIVPAPGPDVLSIRLAITGIQPVSPPLGVTDFIPIKAIFNAGRAAAGDAPKVAELSAEIEVLDGKGRQAAAVVATRKAEKNLSQKDRITWNDLTPIVDAWSKNFRAALDEARGLGRAKQYGNAARGKPDAGPPACLRVAGGVAPPGKPEPGTTILAPSRQLFEIVDIPRTATGTLVGLEVGEADKMQRQAVMLGGFAIGPGGVEIHPVDVGQQVDAEWRVAELHHILGDFEIPLRKSHVAKPELVQRDHQSLGIFRASANPDVEIAGMARPTMQCHGIAAHHEVLNPVSV
jgi:hypothetical protein